ncbi:hypothetical protein CAPTEDRAFT_115613 [Capitella teleta]|uniref:G-protein coupled receptors family 1 profile domain-containing protein n=1 Tax=Capitella teleta TaxID=283909 RepID=R7T3Q3_CAPTE|nr:hypothetical protein CAPTEDRAFT_115613 [Capitella teleta]|eukprot:ELT87363.1 hypothetical protein CAPTEDRAFT_115613 [Capitella teleta]
MSSLTKLDLSANTIRYLQSEFAGGLSHLKVLYLYGNEIQEYDASDFASFNLLDMLHTDEYLFCCLARLNEENCRPLPDKLSSCKDLMREGVLRAFLWIFGIMALLGNLFSIGYHMKMVEKKTVTSELTKYLACADCLFGVYMICIASVDQHYRGVYIEYAKAWKHSAACAFLGTLATFSSEASVLVLFVITCDRLLRITRPFSKKNLTLRSVHKVMLIVWSLVIAIAVVPLIPSDYFKGRFYSRSSVCMSIHITRESPPGWQYSVAVCHGLNLLAFLFILLAYGYMYTRIKSSSKAAGNKGSHEMTIARKMTLIVLTDFCCWFPINTMGKCLLALGGMDIPGEMYSWTIVFILPINSAINPILYTISNLSFKV